MDEIKSSPATLLLKIVLWLALVATIIMGFWIRVIGAGWGLLLFGIPLIIVGVIQILFQSQAIAGISGKKPLYPLLILLSDLFFLLGFALQVDGGDGGSYLSIQLFYEVYFKQTDWNNMPELRPGQYDTYSLISIAFLVALAVCWLLLNRESWLEQKGE